MQFITSISRWNLSFGLVGIMAALLLITIFNTREVTKNIEINNNSVSNKVHLSTSTIPVLVSGVVESADSVTVYAEIAGVVTNLPIKEGHSATVGAVISQQKTTVADAQVFLADAQQGLSYLQQAGAVTESELYKAQATERAYSASDIARLRASSNDNRLSETKSTLLKTLEQESLTAISLVDYVNNHRFIFSAEGLKIYDETVSNIYGSVPKYFTSGKQSSLKSSTDILLVLKELKSNPETSVLDIQILAQTLENQLNNLAYLFTTAEADVFNRKYDYITTDLKTEYLAKRNEVLQAEKNLQTFKASTQQVADQVLEEAITQKTTVKVTKLDEEIAFTQTEYTKKLAEQSAVVAGATKRVAQAQQSLGEIRAPFTGVITKLFTDVGEFITPGSPLMKIVGAGAQELRVTVPSYLLSQVKVGQPLVVEDKVVGFVDRFSEVSEGGSGEVIVSLLNEAGFKVGNSILGHLKLSEANDLYKVPRAYVHFSTNGPYLVYEDGSSSSLEIIYDTGNEFFIKPAISKTEPLLPASELTL